MAKYFDEVGGIGNLKGDNRIWMPRLAFPNLMEEDMSNGRALLVLIAIGLTAPTLGCGQSVEPISDGSVEFAWEISPRGCEDAGVEEIQVDLAYKSGTRTETFNCRKGRATIRNLRPANYKMHLFGIDKAGDATFEAGPKKVTIHGDGMTDSGMIRLTARPAQLRLVWRFDNGLVCGANGVDDLTLSLYDEDDFKVMERTFACTEGKARIPEVPPGEYLAELRGKSEDLQFKGTTEVTARRGKATSVEVVLGFDED